MFAAPLFAGWLLLIVGCRDVEAGSPTPLAPSFPASEAASLRSAALPPQVAASPTPQAPARPAFVNPYPRAAWRLAAPSALGPVVLWVDQILIRHDDARNEVGFSLGHWFAVPPPPHRSRDEALALAQRIAGEAAHDPQRFGELARRRSEDLPHRDEGGSMGGLSAIQLASWPRVLDALAAVSPGLTSKVVETRFGFHVFHRREAAPEARLSGSHIVIGYDQAEWLVVHARGPLPRRSRDDALALAHELYREARARPERFQALVAAHSEHRDAVVEGDFGTWSTREPNPYPLRMQRLQQLAVGAIGTPIETNLGFEIVLRTPARDREQYAARVARLHFDPNALEPSERSRARVLTKAQVLARAYAADPTRFGAPGEESTHVIQWEHGRGVPGLDRLLPSLSLGQVTAAPVEAEFSFCIAQRQPPEAVLPPRFETELPAPEHPDVHYHVSRMSAAKRQQLWRSVEQVFQSAQPRSATGSSELRALQEGFELEASAQPATRRAAFARLMEHARVLLGPRGYAAYLSALEHELASRLLAATDASFERGF